MRCRARQALIRLRYKSTPEKPIRCASGFTFVTPDKSLTQGLAHSTQTVAQGPAIDKISDLVKPLFGGLLGRWQDRLFCLELLKFWGSLFRVGLSWVAIDDWPPHMSFYGFDRSLSTAK